MTTSEAMTGRNDDVFIASLPGSKSYTNRALLLAAMRPGTTAVVGGLRCDDTNRLSDALRAFGGLDVTETAAGFSVTRSAQRITAPPDPVHMGAAGTPARFLLGFAAAAEGTTVVTGDARLRARPMGGILDALRGLGIGADCLGEQGCLPVRVTGGTIASRDWAVRGEVSSQFVSSLLLLASHQTDGPVRLEIKGSIVSKPYVDMTLALLNSAGISASWSGDTALVVHPGPAQHDELTVEPDASSMSYALAAAAITGTQVAIQGLGAASAQGDVGFATALERMGCSLSTTDDSIALAGGPLSGIDISCRSMPDAVPTLAIVAACARGTTTIHDIAHLRLKESDRIDALATELRRVGVTVEEGADSLIIEPGELKAARIRTYTDHRVAMAFAILGLVVDGLEIEDPACVTKSYPGFWDELARFRAHHRTRVSPAPASPARAPSRPPQDPPAR